MDSGTGNDDDDDHTSHELQKGSINTKRHDTGNRRSQREKGIRTGNREIEKRATGTKRRSTEIKTAKPNQPHNSKTRGNGEYTKGPTSPKHHIFTPRHTVSTSTTSPNDPTTIPTIPTIFTTTTTIRTIPTTTQATTSANTTTNPTTATSPAGDNRKQ